MTERQKPEPKRPASKVAGFLGENKQIIMDIEEFRIMEKGKHFFIQRKFKEQNAKKNWSLFRREDCDVYEYRSIDMHGSAFIGWLSFDHLEKIKCPEFNTKKEAADFIYKLINDSRMTYHYPPFKTENI